MSRDSPLSGDTTQLSVPPEAERPPLSKDVFVSYASQDAAERAIRQSAKSPSAD